MKQYKVGKCSWGKIGLILSNGREPVQYSDETIGYAYTGFTLNENDESELWSSRDPEILFEITLEEKLPLKNKLNKVMERIETERLV